MKKLPEEVQIALAIVTPFLIGFVLLLAITGSFAFTSDNYKITYNNFYREYNVALRSGIFWEYYVDDYTAICPPAIGYKNIEDARRCARNLLRARTVSKWQYKHNEQGAKP